MYRSTCHCGPSMQHRYGETSGNTFEVYTYHLHIRNPTMSGQLFQPELQNLQSRSFSPNLQSRCFRCHISRPSPRQIYRLVFILPSNCSQTCRQTCYQHHLSIIFPQLKVSSRVCRMTFVLMFINS